MKTFNALARAAALLALLLVALGSGPCRRGLPRETAPRAAPSPTPKPKRSCFTIVNRNGEVTDICP